MDNEAPKIKVQTLILLALINGKLYEQDDADALYVPSVATINTLVEWLNTLDMNKIQEEEWIAFAKNHNKAVLETSTETATDGS